MTLAELLVSIAIIALVAAIAVPFYRTITVNLDLKAAERDIASDLRLAQQLSVTSQINYQVIFNISGNSYSVKNAATGASVKARVIKPPIRILSISGLSNDTVTFNAIGAATSTGSIILINSNNVQKTITIEPSGYVRI